MNLLLFDIDGTILDASKAGAGSFLSALEEVFGTHPDDPPIQFAGNTDLNILEEIMSVRGREWTVEEENRFFDTIPQKLEGLLSKNKPEKLPGMDEVLGGMSQRDDVLMGLVTGNIERCAWVKLNSLGLGSYFFGGGFGNDHGDRREMARLAVQRAEKRLSDGAAFRQVILIGDTPSDMTAAKAVDALAVGVLTGGGSREEMIDAGADVVMNDLSCPDELFALLR